MAGPGRVWPEGEDTSALRDALRHTELTVEELWLRYFSLGGDDDLIAVEAHLAGLVPLSRAQADVVALVVNERIDELAAQRRVPYSRTVRQERPATGPLTALVGLLSAAGSAPPERLPELAAEAGRALGVGIVVHLIDHEQRRLVRMPPAEGPGEPTLGLDSTIAGRAFRSLRILSSDREERPRLWVPVLDGADRLGVLEVHLADPADLYEPALRHLVAVEFCLRGAGPQPDTFLRQAIFSKDTQGLTFTPT
jgi:hypothetical protein